MARSLAKAALQLRDALAGLKFGPPVAWVYQPLDYAWAAHEAYLKRCGQSRGGVVFLGMNPGPFGMAQTGVPFGEVAAVRDWIGIDAPIGRPPREHPKRRIEGFGCAQSEVSGRRLWGLFAQRFGTAAAFFSGHFVANYCPLVFMEESGRNVTPDQLPAAMAAQLEGPCDAHLQAVLEILEPRWVIGVGGFAQACSKRVAAAMKGNFQLGKVLHPSPASPAANRGWAEAATRQLIEQGVWQA